MVDQFWDTNKTSLENISAMQTHCEGWSRSEFGNTEKKKQKLLARIEGTQRAIERQPHNGILRLEKKLRAEFDEVLHQEELKWFQKSKEDWILSGELNTKFYYAATMV